MAPRSGLLLVLIIGLAACGGGGGAASNPSPAPSPPPPNGGEQPEPPPPSSTEPSTAEILFPRHGSAALGSTVAVSGTASDPDGVAAVRVNGVPATLFPTSPGPAGSVKSRSSVQVLAPLAGLQSDEENSAADVEWVVEVPLDYGENELNVTVEDATGDVTEDAGAGAVGYYLVPIPFHLDEHAPRLIGRAHALTQFGDLGLLVQHDYATEEQTTYPELFGIPVAACFRAISNEWLYLVLAGSNDWQLRRFNLTARESTVIAPIPPQELDPGPGFNDGLLNVRLVCSDTHSSTYMLASYSDGNDLAKSRILEIDGGGVVTLLTETDPNEAPPWLAREIALAGDGIISIQHGPSGTPLMRIELADGARSALAPDVGGLALAPALDSQRVYVATLAGIDEIDLSVDPPEARNISAVSSTDPFVFEHVRSMALDLVNNRIIVGDSGLDALIAVDLDTGERSNFLSRKVGTGAPLIAPRRLAMTADGALAYVADDGGNAPERLFEIDLATGDRRLIGDINLPFNMALTGIGLDEDAGYVYVSRRDRIMRVNIETGGIAILASNNMHDPFSPLEDISDMLLDVANQRLLVGDSGSDAIYSLNLDNNQLSVLSRAGTHGDGEAFVTIASMTMAEDGLVIYVADQGIDQIVRVDVESGDRELLETTCPLGSDPETLSQVLYDAHRDQLLIRADGVFVYDFEEGSCTSIPSRLHPLDVRFTPSEQILAAAFNAVVQIDRRTGDLVIVSK